ncbi:MAG TPA: ParB/RepB/Spo0J family partition protein [Chloroflexia bacterium]|nr:ParB/RepB/Spo0J family partition protein [Chloroflexia bacterium]
MSTPNQSSLGKRKLLKESPFQKLAQRTEGGNEALKEARQIDIAKIETNPRQPRRSFDSAKLAELTEDIKARGILQPPIVRPIPGTDRFEIVVGERRYQAAKQAGKETIPVLVRDLDDQEAEITSLVENIQREDLSLSDEVSYFKMLQNKYDYSISEIAEEVAHKSRSYVEVRLRLYEHAEVLELVETGRLGMQEANVLMRDKANLEENLKKLKKSLQNAQTVFSKDTSLQNAQTIDEKTPVKPEARGEAETYARPFLTMVKNVQNIGKRLEKADLREKQVILDSIEQLEKEIAQLKRRLKGR